MGLLECPSRVALPLLLWGSVLASQACKAAPAGEREAAPVVSAAPPEPAAPPPSAAPSASTTPFVPYSGDRLFEGKCPSYVRGSRTVIDDTKDGMRVTITAEAGPAVAEIRDRSRYLAEGKSQGSDGTGRCPVPRNAKIEVLEIEGGVELRVLPASGVTPKDLRKRARDMLAKIPAT